MPCVAVATQTVTTQTVNTQNVARVGVVENINNVDNVAFKDWKPPTWDNAGELKEKFWQKAAAVAVATANTVAMIAIARKQYKIAKDYANLAKDKWDRFRTVYMPCEMKELAEACQTAEYEKKYDEQANRYGSVVRQVFPVMDERLQALARRYYLCLDMSFIRDLAFMQTTAVGDATNFAYRYEEARKEAQDDLRWNRRANALNRGRDIEANAVKYADMASRIYDDVGGTIKQGLEGALSGLGYLSARAPTQYPTSNGAFSSAATVNGMTGNGSLRPTVSNMIGGFNDFTSAGAQDGTGGFQVSPGQGDFQVLGG